VHRSPAFDQGPTWGTNGLIALLSVLVVTIGACSPNRSVEQAQGRLEHLIFIMQENRSFDSYFGTYPGADGIPAKDGHFTSACPTPKRSTASGPSMILHW